MPRFLLSVFLAFAACAEAPDSPPAAPPPDSGLVAEPPDLAEAEANDGRIAAFDTALDTLEALVLVLQHVEGPVAAWNRAAEAARLLGYLEQNRAAFALDMEESEALQRYPIQIERLRTLETQRTAEMERIQEDPITLRVLLEEMAKANADTTGS